MMMMVIATPIDLLAIDLTAVGLVGGGALVAGSDSRKPLCCVCVFANGLKSFFILILVATYLTRSISKLNFFSLIQPLVHSCKNVHAYFRRCINAYTISMFV